MADSEIAILGLLFLAVVGVVAALGAIFGGEGRLKERLRTVGGGNAGRVATGGVDREAESPLQRIAAPVARIALPDTEEEITRFRAKFFHAGIRSRAAPMYFFAIKTALALGMPLLMWLVIQFSSSGMTAQNVLMILIVMAGLGYYLPNMVLGSWVARRQLKIFEAFPDAIDLMVVCIEAGLSLDMAIQRTAKEMELRSAELADELSLVGTELRIGNTRERALRNLASRTGVEEIRMFVAMLLQADRFGTSVADSMRIHAEELRLRRQMRAEEAATKIPTKLLFPLMLTIFPALMLVLVGPAVIGMARTILPMMSSGV
jgi:tight adherence protein C